MEEIDDDIAEHGKLRHKLDRIVCQKLLLKLTYPFSTYK